ncbi:MAG: hypothetical protein ACYCX7_03485 [Solirubrobacteraceae bacterium]
MPARAREQPEDVHEVVDALEAEEPREIVRSAVDRHPDVIERAVGHVPKQVLSSYMLGADEQLLQTGRPAYSRAIATSYLRDRT